MTKILLGLTCLVTVAHADDAKLSLRTTSDRDEWQATGFRLGLGLVYGRFDGLHGAPSGRLLGANMHAGLRLDARWSLIASFQYASASQAGGLSGLRFAGTLDPTWHVTPTVSLALGFGFGGIVEGRTNRPDMAQQATDVSLTLPSPDPPLPSCSGVGAAGLARAEKMWIIGPHSSTNLQIEVIGQYTSCVAKTGHLEPDTAQPIVRTQYWPHVGATLSWGFAWR